MNARLYRRLLLVFGILILLSAACAMPGYTNKEPTVPAETLAVRTIEAMITQIAGESITKAPAEGRPTGSTEPSSTPQPTTTIAPSSTPIPTATQVVLPSATATPICDRASFVSDISIPDGTVLPVGTTFIKTWRLKNTGACAWTIDYAIVFDSGKSMDAPSSINLPEAVMPGDTVDISVKLTAPDTIGKYRGYWKLRNKSGVLFGTGSNNERFYVDIETVPETSANGYNFVSNYCLAQWTGNDQTLACSGHEGSSAGFVLYVSKPVLETGYQDDEPALITNPPSSKDSIIRGKFPPYTVKSGDKFDALIGCAYEAQNCNVRFQLDYQIDDGSIQNLAAWVESYDKAFTNVNVDLSSLAGKKVKFVLTVFANGDSNNDRAQWLQPRIITP